MVPKDKMASIDINAGIDDGDVILVKEEKEFVNAREKHNRLGFAVLMKTFSFLGYFVTDLNKVPISMVTHLAVQLSLEPDTVKRYNKLTSVKKYHVQLIKKYYGINLFDAECKKLLYDWLLQQYRITSDHNNIVKGCIQKIRNEHWELPAISYIESIVNDALESTNQEFYTHFEKVLSSKQKSMINELVRPLQEKQKKSELSLLKLIPGDPFFSYDRIDAVKDFIFVCGDNDIVGNAFRIAEHARVEPQQDDFSLP